MSDKLGKSDHERITFNVACAYQINVTQQQSPDFYGRLQTIKYFFTERTLGRTV